MQEIEFKEFQHIAKDLLGRVVDFFEEHSLKYSLAFGTLLGAVRHQDIIPWDYDIDLIMPRPDFNRFLELTKEPNTIENTTVYSWKTHKEYYLPFVKICDNRTRLVITKTTSKLPFGIWVDIFPVDGLSEDLEAMQAVLDRNLGYSDKAISSVLVAKTFKEKIYKLRSKIKSVVYPPAYWISKIDKEAEKYPYDLYEFVGRITTFHTPILFEYLRKEWVEDPVYLKFGNRYYSCISGYDEFLYIAYGDYMTLPPEQERIIPNIKSYRIDK